MIDQRTQRIEINEIKNDCCVTCERGNSRNSRNERSKASNHRERRQEHLRQNPNSCELQARRQIVCKTRAHAELLQGICGSKGKHRKNQKADAAHTGGYKAAKRPAQRMRTQNCTHTVHCVSFLRRWVFLSFTECVILQRSHTKKLRKEATQRSYTEKPRREATQRSHTEVPSCELPLPSSLSCRFRRRFPPPPPSPFAACVLLSPPQNSQSIRTQGELCITSSFCS